MIIFSSRPGVVSAVLTGGALPFAIALGGTGGVPAFPGYQLAKAVLTGFALEGESGLMVNHTLRDRIYVYIHGERAGTAQVSGVAFGDVCDGGAGAYTGLDAVYAYYERTRAATQGLPVRLVFGPNTSLVGFLTKMRLGVEDAATGVAPFTFSFVTLPRYAGRTTVGAPVLAGDQLPPLPWGT